MSWTAAQLQTLYANAYRAIYLCPTCGETLNVVLSRKSDVLCSVRCPACDLNHLISRHNDPLREQFRDYTPAEAKIIKSADKWQQKPVCPIDGTEIEPMSQRSLARASNVVARCRRCDHGVEYTRLQG